MELVIILCRPLNLDFGLVSLTQPIVKRDFED